MKFNRCYQFYLKIHIVLVSLLTFPGLAQCVCYPICTIKTSLLVSSALFTNKFNEN